MGEREMLEKKKKNSVLRNVLKGMAIGVANVIPGVSGGTVAVLLGIYEILTEAIGNFFLVDLRKKKAYFLFLVQIGIGAVLGILLFAKLIEYSVQNYPRVTAAFFSVCILPTLFYLMKPYQRSKKNILCFALGCSFMILFILLGSFFQKETGLDLRSVVSDQLFSLEGVPVSYGIRLLFCGSLAAGAMIIPGVSGSLLLLVLGEYYTILSFVLHFQIIPLAYLMLGVALGLVLFSKMIHWLLQHYEQDTMFFIGGIVLMSIVQIWLSLP